MDFVAQLTTERIAAAIEVPDDIPQQLAKITYTAFGPAADAFQSFAASHFPSLAAAVQAVQHGRHPFAAKLPLMNFWYVMFGIFCYFGTVVLLLLVSNMVGRGKYKLVVLLYNLFLAMLSLYMTVGIFVSAHAAGYSIWNNAAGTSAKEWRLAKFLWIFYVSKILEWMDSFLMCLKCNYHQITFLHLYHHSTVLFILFVCCFRGIGGDLYWSAMLNSAVHVIMYGYYFFICLFEEGKVRRFLSHFKFIIMKIQMLQFLVNCAQASYGLYVVPRASLKYDDFLLTLLLGYMISLLVLFANFIFVAQRSQGRKKECNSAPTCKPQQGEESRNTAGAETKKKRTYEIRDRTQAQCNSKQSKKEEHNATKRR